MDRGEYTAVVLAQLRRVTREERAAISAELDAHMEDHVCALLELGYPETEAARRAVECMGDPVETGRELDRQYRHWWLVVVRCVARAVLIFACILLLGQLRELSDIGSAVAARHDSGRSDYSWAFANDIRILATERVDDHFAVGDDVLRIACVSLADDLTGRYAGARVVIVQFRTYDHIPGGYVSQEIAYNVRLSNERGEQTGNAFLSSGLRAARGGCILPVAPADRSVTLRCDYMGCHIERVIELPEVESDG